MFMEEALPEDKTGLYSLLGKQLQALLSGEEDVLANMANTASLLFLSLPNVNWVGFYILRGDELVLGPFQGKPGCVRIPVGKGVCGQAVSQGDTLRVEDVCEFPGHIACDPQSRSEIVIPLYEEGQVVAVLDIDSPLAGRFDREDQAGLESIVSLLAERRISEQLFY